MTLSTPTAAPGTILGSLALSLALAGGPAVAQKEPALIRQHVLEQVSVSSEPFHEPALDELIEPTMWRVAIEQYGGGQSMLFMAVDDGEVLRIHRHGTPESRENFIRLLPDDFRVGSEAEARRMIAAVLTLHSEFSEPEVPLEEIRVEARDGEYLFVDGDRFGEATGYRITYDAEQRPTGFEYSWELDTEPLEEAG
ncbi:hypothetical protein [Histidinibacterium aquaticum]|uniref:PepSY domain-containing protein n=1 Tax=Histidinibacterium aquaticum TaxID=2613962 RepID=A0A5J5GB88_9RHOB|nr:hypothetical protein [Histidinibacterium aquaticum]KAA9005082.1 hypothetical protein F3S47_18815 [Histidinibacterium aquaticum]